MYRYSKVWFTQIDFHINLLHQLVKSQFVLSQFPLSDSLNCLFFHCESKKNCLKVMKIGLYSKISVLDSCLSLNFQKKDIMDIIFSQKMTTFYSILFSILLHFYTQKGLKSVINKRKVLKIALSRVLVNKTIIIG